MNIPPSAPGIADSRTNAESKHNLEGIPLGLDGPVPQSDMLRLYAVHLLVHVPTVRWLKCCRGLKKIKRRRVWISSPA